MSKPSFFPQPLGTIFLTGPDGFVYEVPEEVAKEYRITPGRVAELGHLPLTAYSSANGPEVVGHHFVVNADGVPIGVAELVGRALADGSLDIGEAIAACER